MGTDRVKLFDKTLGDRILAMDQDALIHFLEENSNILSSKAYMGYVGDLATQSSIAEAVETVLRDDYPLPYFKSQVVMDFAFGDEEILLDYWGCHAHVFIENPAGSISSLDYLPDEEEETFVLLLPEHVEQMIKSLREHMHDVTVMRQEHIDKLDEWRLRCAANDNYRVGYLFDF